MAPQSANEDAMKSRLDSIRDKVLAGERLTLEDGLFLIEPTTPLHEVGELANLVRERKNGNVAYYNVNTHLNPTNVCVYRCTFCAFRADLREPKGYVMTDEQILARGQRGGRQRLHRAAHRRRPAPPDASTTGIVNVIRILHEAYPELHLKAWTAVEIDWFCAPDQAGRSREILARLDRRRPRQPARRRGRDLPSRGPRPDLRAQGRRRRLARHPPHGPRAGPALQLHDALRPHRERRTTASTT